MDADPPPPPQDQSLAVDEPEKMDIVNDSEEVADAQTGLENMSVETTEEEWPEENGVEIPDDKIEQRNKVANIRIRDIPGQKSEQSAPSKNVMGKTPKKHSHYKPPDSYVQRLYVLFEPY